MKIVIDTSGLVSSVVSQRGVGAWLLSYWREGRFDVVLSPAIYRELQDVLDRSQLAKKISAERKQAFISRIRQRASWTPGALDASGLTPDPKDDMLLSAALETDAQ